MQANLSTKHIARVKPSQYIAQLATAAVAAAAAAVIRLILLEPSQKPPKKTPSLKKSLLAFKL